MLAVHWDTIRLFLHVLGATVWVGGQLTLAGLVPAVRRRAPELTRTLAQAFNRIAWPAFGLLLATGAWNVAAEHDKVHGAYATTLDVKMGLVVLSGYTAWAHTRATSRTGLAVYGALTGLTALGALFVGVLLAG